MSVVPPQGEPPVQLQKTVETVNTPAFQALFRVASMIMLAYISIVAYIAVGALGDIKDLTNSINRLNIKITEMVGEGRVTANTLSNHEGRITSLEKWRIGAPPSPPR